MQQGVRPRGRGVGFKQFIQCSALAAILCATGVGTASAYIGDSFLDVPGVAGGWRGAQYKNWVRVDADYWKSDETDMFATLIKAFKRPKMFFDGPLAPRKGPSELFVSIDKHSPVLTALMAACASKTTFPEMSYAESSMRSRFLSRLGPRPADIPEYFEYKLKDAQISDCPVVADAPEQAFAVSFNGIEWVNYHGDPEGKAFTLKPSNVKPARNSSTTKSFVVSWIAFAHDVSDDQCERMNEKPPVEAYYTYMSKEEADKERAENAKNNGSADYEHGQMGFRGPHKLNVCTLPGITPPHAMYSPRINVAYGLNLDGNDGTGKPAPGTCAHKNYVSADGRTGIDNQLYRVAGCSPGWLGHKGFLMQYANEERRNGMVSILIQVSGIDNDKNDSSVDVAILYSLDHMAKDSTGKQILPDYTFRLTDNPEYSHYFTRVHGKIVNGIIITDPVKQLQVNMGLDPELTLYDAGLRLQIMPDGRLKGVLGGYQDWRRFMEVNSNSNAEAHYGFECSSLYAALKNAADGLKNPVTGECDGISSAYEIEGEPAFIVPAQPKIAKSNGHGQVAEADATGRPAR